MRCQEESEVTICFYQPPPPSDDFKSKEERVELEPFIPFVRALETTIRIPAMLSLHWVGGDYAVLNRV